MYRVPTTPLKTETKGHRIRPRPFYQGLLGKFTSVSCISETFRQINSKLRGLFLTLSTSRHCNFLSHGVALNLSFFLIWVNICFSPLLFQIFLSNLIDINFDFETLIIADSFVVVFLIGASKFCVFCGGNACFIILQWTKRTNQELVVEEEWP